jgi:hypothetical protein
MKKAIMVLVLAGTVAQAQQYTLLVKTAYTGEVPAEVRVLSAAGGRATWVEDFREYVKAGYPTPSRYPALVDMTTLYWVEVTGTLAQAEADCAAYDPPAADFPFGLVIPGYTNGNARYELRVDQETGEVVASLDHASPRRSRASREADFAAAHTNAVAHRQRIAAIETDLDQVRDALDQIDVSSASSYATNIAACSGATKTALQDTRKVLVDTKAALRNLVQAAEKLRKEVK